jgi:hypothetical protein
MSLSDHANDRPARAFSDRRRVDLPRRLALLIGSIFAIAPAALHASADTAGGSDALTTPRLGCTHAINDATGDAAPDYTGAGSSPLASNDALDIEMVDVRLTASELEVFLALKRIPSPSAMAASEGTYRYTISFSYNGKPLKYAIEQKNPTWPAGTYPSDSVNYPTMKVGTTELASASTGVIQQGTSPDPSWIIFTSPRDKVQDALGGPITDGDSFNTFAVTTQIFTTPETAVHSTNDGLDPHLTPAQDALAAGGVDGDWCFGAPPTTIGSVSVAAADVSDSSTMSATLLDENGKALAGKPLTFAVADGKGTKVTGTTDANGRAVATYGPIRVPAGTYPVTISFAGEGTTQRASTASGTLTVSAEACSFKPLKVAKPSTKTRVVTATLVDDANHAVAGVPVTWWVNGRKVATGKTASNGTVVLKSAKPGQTVQAKFAGVAKMYLAANSKAVRV